MKGVPTIAAGLVDSVHEAQQAFRAVLDALARPGQIRFIGAALPDVALGGAMARLLLSLSDDKTPVWWQCADASLQHWLCFHCGATSTERPDAASFAVITDACQAIKLTDFAAGTAESPEFSGTLLIELPGLRCGSLLEWCGPGIQDVVHVDLQGLSPEFWTQWQANHASFPQGVDIVFTCQEHALGLPRTTRVRRLEGV